MIRKTTNSLYLEYLKNWGFNEAQIALIIEQVKNFNGSEDVDVDTFERDLWYTMNQSGLFEKDDDENESGIDNWTVNDTRRLVTEIPNRFFN